MFTRVYLCLHMFARIYLFLLLFIYVYHFLLVFTCACLLTFTPFNSCLHLLTYV